MFKLTRFSFFLFLNKAFLFFLWCFPRKKKQPKSFYIIFKSLFVIDFIYCFYHKMQELFLIYGICFQFLFYFKKHIEDDWPKKKKTFVIIAYNVLFRRCRTVSFVLRLCLCRYYLSLFIFVQIINNRWKAALF